MAENNFLTYKGKPIVRKGNEIFYGNMSDAYVIRFNIISFENAGENELPAKTEVQLLKTSVDFKDKNSVAKETVRDSFFDALDFGFVWLERALKE